MAKMDAYLIFQKVFRLVQKFKTNLKACFFININYKEINCIQLKFKAVKNLL